MKQLLPHCFLLIAGLALSCTSDESTAFPQSSVTATINGVFTTFDYVEVKRIFYQGYTDIEIVATTANDPNNWLTFKLTEYATGADITYFFAYYIDLIWYEQQPTLICQVTENNTRLLQGTFSGTVEHFSSDIKDVVTITDGQFVIAR